MTQTRCTFISEKQVVGLEYFDMTSAQDFEVILRSKSDIDEATLKDVLATIKQVVENSACDMAVSNMKSKLNKKYGGDVHIISALSGRRVFYWIADRCLPPAYRRGMGMVTVSVKVNESFNLLNLALRKVMKMVKDRQSIQTLEIPQEVKDVLNKYWSF